MAECQPGPSSHGDTVLIRVFTLLHAPSPSQPYLHPYAPQPTRSGWKGKARDDRPSLEDQVRLVREMGAALDGARAVLGRRDGDWAKLSRALREVVTHQSALLPLTEALVPQPLPPSGLLSPQVSFSPIELLQALAKELDIQTYLEDSQFGLLKTSLTLAGNRFVVDIDLETDPAAGEDADVDIDADAEGDTSCATGNAGVTERDSDARGKVRLSKLGVNHVTSNGGTGKSEHVAAVLRAGLEGYLEEWDGGADGEEGVRKASRLEKRVRRLRYMLEQIKVLDEVAVSTNEGADHFADLEEVARTIEGWIKGEGPIIVYSPPNPAILPSFRLLPDGADISPTLQIRPARIGESVPLPLTPSVGEGVDVIMTEGEVRWLSAAWVLEVVTESNVDGLVVRRSCFIPGEAREKEGAWDGGVKVENMLYCPDPSSSLANRTPSAFPYTADFVHRPWTEKGGAEALEQHWSIAQPGPDAFVLGRIGVSSSTEALKSVIEALRRQAVLNAMFGEVFDPTHLAGIDGDDGLGDGDAALDNLMWTPTALPITLTLLEDSLRISFPAPHVDSPPTITITLVPGSSEPSYVVPSLAVTGPDGTAESAGGLSAEQEEAVRGALGGEKGLVRLVRRVEAALRTV